MTGALLLSACGGGDGESKNDAAAVGTSGFRFLSGTAKQNSADLTQGDTADNATPSVVTKNPKPVLRKWVQLSAGKAGDLNPVTINGAGFVLYRFDKDATDPSKSNCSGDCATTWPPYLVAPGGKVFLDGVRKENVGFIRRDGGFQVTIGGSPVYLFSQDTKAGDTNGQGRNGTWFGVTPDGQRAGRKGGGKGAVPPLPSGPATTPAATSATFFDSADFAEPAEGIVGPGCKPVRFNGSVSLTGFATVWSGDNCTGRSARVDKNVKDLNALGIGPVKSIGFASGESTGSPSPTASAAANATFFDAPNFGEPAQGVGGPGCQAVRFGGSVSLSGSAKVWSGDNCTGRSKVIDSNVADLDALGIGTIKSIRFAG
ncbi:hypothetical protein NX794_24870 [Streptomyces sp. LP11]|uniref:Lipoprotein n=1 Tax=Streptomyces pyxinicus TaxID=2970331 RepID=A0ABT2B7C4_9ACTN|nr:hypothetical protein [Streptomyces sp. LP11]MCS0604419.1 hypothetical protein [Streptomyces sp. LP11]